MAFAMIVSALIVRRRDQWYLLMSTNAEYLGTAFDLMVDQVMTLRNAILFIHDILMNDIDEAFSGYRGHFVEPPTFEQLHLLPWTQSEGFEGWHSKSVRTIILDGAWIGCIYHRFVTQQIYIQRMESSFVASTEQAAVRVLAKHDARSYELEGSPTRDNTAFELAGTELTGSYAEGQRIVWKCMLTVFGLTGTIWAVHEGEFKDVGVFWLWRDASSTQ